MYIQEDGTQIACLVTFLSFYVCLDTGFLLDTGFPVSSDANAKADLLLSVTVPFNMRSIGGLSREILA